MNLCILLSVAASYLEPHPDAPDEQLLHNLALALENIRFLPQLVLHRQGQS